LTKLENQNDNEESQEKINEIQEEIKRIKQEAVTKREIAEQSRSNEQKITDIEKEIEEYKQAKVNEEVILENINRKIEENRQNPNQQNPDPNLEADRQTVNQRIAELNGKIVSREAEVANLRKNQS
jgi:restriction endonuclease S subunit